MIEIANLLLTRRCNLNCSYCNLVKDYSDKPVQYKDMKYFHNNELTGEQWTDIIQRLHTHNENIFVILYGGEPFLYKDLEKILKYCNDQNINYTIISNTTGNVVKERIFKLYEKLGPYRGFTSSVDPIAFIPEEEIIPEYSDMIRKSKEGFDYLKMIKKAHISEDVVAEITILKQTIPYLYDTVLKLSASGIVSSITAVDSRKSKYYDFSSIGPTDNCLLEKTQELKQLFARLIEDSNSGKLKIHIPDILNELYRYLPSEYKCKINEHIHNVSIEPDGSFRLCLRISGVSSPLVPYNEAISTTGVVSDKLIEAIRSDYKHYCKACNWTCPIMSEMFSDKIVNH